MSALTPKIGTAQVYARPNPYPQATAANAVWQLRGEPVFHAGAYYFPTGPTVFFDGNVMQRTGTFLGVPIYEDATIEPFSIVYVPIGGNVVRPYERLREGDLVGTTGSRTPSFPIQRDGELSVIAAALGLPSGTFPPINEAPPVIPEAPSSASAPPSSAARHVTISTPPPGAPNGFWVVYEGARWYSAGPATVYSADRFDRVGEYQGFPVYRERNGSSDVIYIPTIADGPVAPYRKN
jgi:hypothetical protein